MAKKFLIVDNEEDICQLFKDILTLDGHDVYTANGGVEAISLLSENKVDTVVLDIMMPDMDGWETLEEMISKELIVGTKVYICSVAEDNPQKMEKYKNHICGVLDKSNILSEIQSKISR